VLEIIISDIDLSSLNELKNDLNHSPEIKYRSLVLELLYIVFGIVNSIFLCFFAWHAFLFGGSEGVVILKWNKYNELFLELIITNIIVIFMIVFSIMRARAKNKEFYKRNEKYNLIIENIKKSLL
jgi:hypothetical protein